MPPDSDILSPAGGVSTGPLTDAAPAAPAAAVEAPVAPRAPSRFDAVVDQWFNTTIQNSEIARITPAYNAVFAALDDLKTRLSQEN